MAVIVTRETTQTDGTSPKGSPLTNAEVDANFINLNDNKVEVSGAIVFEANAGEALTKGDAVYVSGISGNKPVVSKADADDASKMPAFGLAETDATLNSAVNVVTFGTIYELDTSGFSAGDTVYVSTTAGVLSNSAPTGESSLIQNMGKVIRSHASAGSIKVGGAGRTNATPNLNDGNVFIGNASNQSVARALTASDIQSGTFADARIAESNVTQHEAALSITESQISDLQSYLTSVALNDVSDVTITSASSGQVLKYNGSAWINDTDAGGIEYTDLSVTTNAAGTAALSYNNANGVFTYTPPDLSSYLTSYTETDPVFSASASSGITSTNISNWNTAYGWGDHASAGYLTSYTETDPVFSASAASGITSTNITNWNTAYGWGNHASAGYFTTSNDGSGSGLDADLLDGQQGSYYTSLANATGEFSTISATSASSRDKIRVYPSSNYAIGMQDNITYGHLADWAMTFQMNDDTQSDRGFWWGDAGHGLSQGAMSLTTNGRATIATSLSIGQGESITGPNSTTLYVGGNAYINGATYGGLSIGETPTNYDGWNTQLNVNGSSHSRVNVKTANVRMGIYAHDSWHGGAMGHVGTYTNHQLSFICNAAQRAVLTTAGSLSTTSQGTLWGASNDGSGSGLDADTLDGVQGSSYLRSDTSDTFTGNLTIASGSLTLPAGYNLQWGAGYSSGKSTIWSDGTANIIRMAPTGNSSGKTLELSATATTSIVDLQADADIQSKGQIRAQGWWNTPTGNYGDAAVEIGMSSGNGYILSYSRNSSSYTSLNFAGTSFNFDERGGTTTIENNEVWHAGNDGSGSGLDADTLDGSGWQDYTRDIHANQVIADDWLRTTGPTGWYSNTYGGGWRMTDTTWIRTYGSKSIYQDAGTLRTDGTLQVGGSGATLNAPNGGTVTISGSTAWHAGNDGSGSGLDADTLDGYQGSNYIGLNGNSYFQLTTWLQSTGTHGFYSPSSGAGTHFYPAGLGNYGSFSCEGRKGGWGGYAIEGRVVFMHDGSTSSGIYNDVNNHWLFYAINGGKTAMYHNGSEKIYTYASGGRVTGDFLATGDIYAYYSDERLKDKTGKIENALDKVDAIETFYYTHNDKANELGYDGKDQQVGVSAQSVAEVMPEVVHLAPIDDDGQGNSISGENYQTVNYARLVPLLIESIKELRAEVKDLKEQLK